MTASALQVVLARRPQGSPTAQDFTIRNVSLSAPAEGEVLVRNLWLSIDPYMRLFMGDQGGVHGSVPLGEPMPGGAVGEVIESRSAALPVRSHVVSMAHGWRDHYVAPAEQLQPVSAAAGPLHRFLGLYGLTGVTAWGGIHGVLKPQPGETLFINGAAGAVGSVAVQLARRAGARVIACAGSDEKGAWLTGALGAESFINYRSDDVRARLAELAPEGLDMMFDNVGGEQLEIAIDAMKPKGRIALCGAIALYDGDNYRAGPRNLFAIIEKHVSMTGFNAGFYFAEAPRIIAEFAAAEAAGGLIDEVTFVEGLNTMPDAFVAMLGGASRGKVLVKL